MIKKQRHLQPKYVTCANEGCERPALPGAHVCDSRACAPATNEPPYTTQADRKWFERKLAEKRERELAIETNRRMFSRLPFVRFPSK